MGVVDPIAHAGFLLDADVLIDYCEADRAIFRFIRTHLGPVHVLSVVLGEVRQLDGYDVGALGLTLVEPGIDQMYRALDWQTPALSFQDRLGLIVARDHGYICVTNDGKLRRECRRQGVRVRWGLEMLITLVDAGAVSPHQAAAWAHTIRMTNPRITDEVLASFLQKIRLPP